MSAPIINTSVLRKMLALQEKKEDLQSKIVDIDSQLVGLLGAAQTPASTKATPAKRGRPAKKVAAKRGRPAKKVTVKKPVTPTKVKAKVGRPKSSAPKAAPAAKKAKAGARRGRKRGQTGQKIVRALKAAGKGGASVKELSAKTKIKSQNLYVWFNSTGRKVEGLKKIGKARYAFSA